MMSFFERKYKGRGIRLVVTFSPPLSQDEVAQCKEFGRMCVLNEHFTGIDVGLFTDEPTHSQIKIFCSEATFHVKLSEAERVYTGIFYEAYGQIARLAMNVFYKGFHIDEFSFLYRTHPKEATGEFVPLVPLKTVWAFLLWKALFAMSLKQDLAARVPDGDRMKLKEVVREMDDARPVVAENRDFILRMAEHLGVWKPYQSEADSMPLVESDPRLGEAVEKALKEQPEAVSFYHYMPATDGELAMINRHLSQYGREQED
jgi:hypothetical protein